MSLLLVHNPSQKERQVQLDEMRARTCPTALEQLSKTANYGHGISKNGRQGKLSSFSMLASKICFQRSITPNTKT